MKTPEVFDKMIVVDAKDLILGRLATFVAKKALLGEEVRVVNSEEAIITGNKQQIFAKYRGLREMGEPFHGPFYPTRPEAMLKRAIRNMVGYKSPRGKIALQRIKCYNKVPYELKDAKRITIEKANVSKVSNPKKVTLKEVSQFLK